MFFPKNRPIDFHINSISVMRPVKRNQLSFTNIKISKPLPAPVHSLPYARFKFRSEFKLLPQIRCLITFRAESSIISRDSNIIANIFRKVINVQQGKCRTKIGTLRNSSINRIFLLRPLIQNHPKPSITEKRQNKAKYLTRNLIRSKFMKETSILKPDKCLGYIKCYSSSSPRLVKAPYILSDTLLEDLQLIEKT